MELTRAEIEKHRGPKRSIDAYTPAQALVEDEPASKVGPITRVLTLFLKGAECPFRCTMCDLWQETLDEPTPRGALVQQMIAPIKAHRDAEWIKLYNASNFFDPRAVPPEDYVAIAKACEGFDHIIVENHPCIKPPANRDIRSIWQGCLEVAMGLETVHPASMKLLNKQMTLDDFASAVERWYQLGVDCRAFILIQPPGTVPQEAFEWSMRTLEFAQHCGVRHSTLIPTRGGNGIMEKLQTQGLFAPPSAGLVEAVLRAALQSFPFMVVTADLWDWGRLAGTCARCSEPRRKLLERMNLSQKPIIEKRTLDCGCAEYKD